MPDLNGSMPRRSLSTFPPWTSMWLTALTRPSVATYEGLIREPHASAGSAYTWVFISTLIGGSIISLVPLVSQWAQQQPVDITLLLAIPVTSIVTVLVWGMFVGCTQGIARLLRGGGTYTKAAYASSLFSAPLTIAVSVLSLIPHTGWLLVCLYIYWCFLYIVAVQAVNRISWIKAVTAVLMSVLLVSCVVLGVMVLAGR